MPILSQYTQLGVMTKGTVIEVNVSELGLVTYVLGSLQKPPEH